MTCVYYIHNATLSMFCNDVLFQVCNLDNISRQNIWEKILGLYTFPNTHALAQTKRQKTHGRLVALAKPRSSGQILGTVRTNGIHRNSSRSTKQVLLALEKRLVLHT